jgi:hypothetical protein
VLGLAVTVAMVVTALIGWAFERIIIMPVYGQHLKQILITMGGMIVAEQLINVIWGAEQIPLPLPTTLRGAIFLGDAAIEKYRLLAVVVGLVVFAVMFLVLNRTKIGLLIRAGVENGEMVEAMGYRIRRLFVGVFAAGSALAGLGGVMWGLYKETLWPRWAASHGHGLHRHHHRRPGLGRRLLHRRAADGAGGQLCRLPGAEIRAGLEHRADDRHPAVASGRPVFEIARLMLFKLLSGDLPRSRRWPRSCC